MATFKKADEIYLPQSVGPKTAGGNLNSTFQVFQPTQGREVLYNNPQLNGGSTEVQNDYDRRIPLGTYTLNDRDSWENNNFNESTFQSYLNEEFESNKSYRLQTRESITVETLDGDITIPPSVGGLSKTGPYAEHNTGKFSVEALPFVINPNNDEIIHVDRYYDKEIDKENYELATEGKINLKLQANKYGRVPVLNSPGPYQYAPAHLDYIAPEYLPELNFGLNIDIFSSRGRLGSGAWFDNVINSTNSTGENDGIYLFKLNWNDGSEIEYTDKPQLLERTTLFEHFYDKPGFYTISGVMYRIYKGYMTTWEKFETNILLNPSSNYELDLFDYNNFASIGGISKDSAFVKSLYNIVGINPLTQDNSGASEDIIEELNELDKIQLLNILGKVDYQIIESPYGDVIERYSKEIIDVPVEGYVAVAGAGCTDSNAINFDSAATQDDPYNPCIYTFDVEVNNVETEQNLNYIAYFIPGGLSPADNLPDMNLGEGVENGWWEDVIQNNETLPTNFPISLIQSTTGNTPKVFIKFMVGNNPPDGIVGLTDTQSNFSLLPTVVIDGTNDANVLVFGWYRLVYNLEPGPNNYGGVDRLEEVNFQIDPEFTGDEDEDPDETIDAVLYSGLTATLTGENSDWYFVNSAGETQWIPYGSDTPRDQWTTTDHGWYHIHASGKIHIGAGGHGGDHDIPEDELIEQGAPPPPQEYTIVLHNSPLSGMGETGTVYSKVRFPSGPGVNNTIGISNGFPQGDAYISGPDSLTLSTNVSGTNALLNAGSVVTIEGQPENDRNAWDGWYSDAEFTNLLTSNNTHTFIVYTFGTEVYGSPTNTTIHLYAKVLTGI